MDNARFKELWLNDELNEVDEEIDDSWRHGNNMSTVYEYKGQYWCANYQVSGDGEYHGIREDDFDLVRVFPETKVVTITNYTTKVPAPKSKTAFRRKIYQIEACQFPGGSDEATADFIEWINVNRGDVAVSIADNMLCISRQDHKTYVPAGMWIVKEVGNEIYPLTDKAFKDMFEPL